MLYTAKIVPEQQMPDNEIEMRFLRKKEPCENAQKTCVIELKEP